MAANSPDVTHAINAALDDINLLRALIYAQTPDAANAILTAYDQKLTLKGSDVQSFYALLTRGHVTITASLLNITMGFSRSNA
jgi:hypothetical protein